MQAHFLPVLLQDVRHGSVNMFAHFRFPLPLWEENSMQCLYHTEGVFIGGGIGKASAQQ